MRDDCMGELGRQISTASDLREVYGMSYGLLRLSSWSTVSRTFAAQDCLAPVDVLPHAIGCCMLISIILPSIGSVV